MSECNCNTDRVNVFSLLWEKASPNSPTTLIQDSGLALPCDQHGGTHMNIAVYAICKNEAQFVERWVKSMSEADAIYVLDTGSTDDTPALLESLGVTVKQQIVTPWRFDVARNLSLDMVPEDADICVCTDLDEVFRPGWRRELERAWLPWVQQVYYRYTWSFSDTGEELMVFQKEKIHTRHGFVWTHPVHEVLQYTGAGEPAVICLPNVQLDHHPDPAKSRGQYLGLLELAVAEAPDDDRNRHYLGREYFFYGRYADCIHTLQTHLLLPSATWADERAASRLYIARSYAALGELANARKWYVSACAEAPHLRETWLGLAEFAYGQEDWNTVLQAVTKALDITERSLTYLSDSRCWGSLPYDLGAIAAWHLGMKEQAAAWGQKALEMEPDNERLRENMKWYA